MSYCLNCKAMELSMKMDRRLREDSLGMQSALEKLVEVQSEENRSQAEDILRLTAERDELAGRLDEIDAEAFKTEEGL